MNHANSRFHFALRGCIPALFLTLFCVSGLFGQKATLSGRVVDQSTGEYILGATVVVDGTNTGSASNVYGFYSLSLPPGTYDPVSYTHLTLPTICSV